MNIVEFNPGYYPNPTIGRPLSNADIYVGEPDLDPEIVGNQKQLSVLQENSSIVTVSQPINTGFGGVPVYDGSYVTLLVDGDYSLKVLDSNGSQVYYIPNAAKYEPYVLLSSYDDLSSAIAAIGATETELWIDADDTLTESVVSPATLKIKFLNGNVVDGAYTWTINGPLEAGAYQIFGSLITIAGGDLIPFGYAEWYGGGIDANDNTDIFVKVIATFTNIKLLKGTYVGNIVVDSIRSGIIISGSGRDTTFIKPVSGIGIQLIGAWDSESYNLNDFTIDADDGTHGLTLGSVGNEVAHVDVNNIHIKNASTAGLEIFDAIEYSFTNCLVDDNAIGLFVDTGRINTTGAFINCQFRTSTAQGVLIRGGKNVTFSGCVFETNGGNGQEISGASVRAVVNINCWYENNNTTGGSAHIVIERTGVFDAPEQCKWISCSIDSPQTIGVTYSIDIQHSWNNLFDTCYFYEDPVKNGYIDEGATGNIRNTIIKNYIPSELADFVLMSDRGPGESGIIYEVSSDDSSNRIYTNRVFLVIAVADVTSYDVTGRNEIMVDTSGANRTVNSFVNGKDGQTIKIIKSSASNNLNITHNYGSGGEPLLTMDATSNVYTVPGTLSFTRYGGSWYQEKTLEP